MQLPSLRFGQRPCGRAFSRRSLLVRADAGVQDLLARDVKQPKLAPELQDGGAKSSSSKGQSVIKSRQQRRNDGRTRLDGATEVVNAPDRPKRCKEALDKGLALFQQKQFNEAIDMFNLALELPGNGAYRLPNSPREYSCPSDAEEQAALFNMACAYAQMGQKSSSLTCLEAVLDLGFEDFNTVRTDPDLAPVRSGPELNELLSKYDNPMAKLKKAFGNDKQLKSDTNKPWVLW